MILPRSTALAADTLMCGLINLVQSRHRLNGQSRNKMEYYVAACERLTIHDYYRYAEEPNLAREIPDRFTVRWKSPLQTRFPTNDVARADLFPCSRGWSAPTVIMLHALMSATSMGYRRWAAHFNARGWNACFVHLPFHYSRVPPSYWNGELAITADLIRNAEGLRQGVIELRQLIGALRVLGCEE